jgi:disulfide bond formation protein DsbB
MLVAWGGVASTLLYSEYFGFIPCSLCWLQRIALYPQALVGSVAWRVRDAVYFPLYGIALSVFGLIVAVYQYIYQMMPAETVSSGALPCLADGTADCATKVMEVFGFVTFPFLSAVSFAFMIVVYLHMRRAAVKVN